MSEEEKATTPAAETKAPAETPKEEESTAEFAPVVRLWCGFRSWTNVVDGIG